MILSLGSYVRYPADNIRFRLIAKLKLYSNLLVTDAFACWVLVYFVCQVIFFGRGKQAEDVSGECS